MGGLGKQAKGGLSSPPRASFMRLLAVVLVHDPCSTPLSPHMSQPYSQ